MAGKQTTDTPPGDEDGQSGMDPHDHDHGDCDHDHHQHEPYRRAEPKIGRNDPCPCGSGRKHKKCCGA
jgi:preprotein translocase subunit SecA